MLILISSNDESALTLRQKKAQTLAILSARPATASILLWVKSALVAQLQRRIDFALISHSR